MEKSIYFRSHLLYVILLLQNLNKNQYNLFIRTMKIPGYGPVTQITHYQDQISTLLLPPS